MLHVVCTSFFYHSECGLIETVVERCIPGVLICDVRRRLNVRAPQNTAQNWAHQLLELRHYDVAVLFQTSGTVWIGL